MARKNIYERIKENEKHSLVSYFENRLYFFEKYISDVDLADERSNQLYGMIDLLYENGIITKDEYYNYHSRIHRAWAWYMRGYNPDFWDMLMLEEMEESK